MRTVAIPWDAGSVTARIRGTDGPPVLFAHGAGTNQDHPLVAGLAGAMADRRLQVVTFNYPYTEAGKKAPDRAPKLLACHRSVAAWARAELGDLVFAGRSMGGRMSSMLAAEPEPMTALVLFAYPLHPAGKPDRLRIDHLPDIQVPMLFVQGSRDRLSAPDLFDRHLRSLTRAEVFDLDGADHSWRIRGRDLDDVNAEVAEFTAHWIHHLATGR